MKEENVNKVSSLLSNKDVFSCSYAGKCIRRILLIVCAVMLFSINSQAQTLKTLSTYFSGKGTGTLVDPYQISTANDLEYLAVVCWTRTSFASTEQTNYETSGKYFQLQGNIDCSSITSFLPLGGVLTYKNGSNYTNLGVNNGEYSFRGTFDGNNKTISNINITVPSTTTLQTITITNGALNGSNSVDYTYTYYLGNSLPSAAGGILNKKATTKGFALFGATYNATIKNLGVKDVQMSGVASAYSNNRAGMAAFMNGTTIKDSYVENINLVDATNTANSAFVTSDAGFVCFSGNGASVINNCYVKDAHVEGGDAGCFGGFMDNMTINNCYVSGTSTVKSNYDNTNNKYYAGCFCGGGTSSGYINNCYSLATVASGSTVNRIAAFTTIKNTVTNCYYVSGTGATYDYTAGSSKTSDEMLLPAFVDLLNTTTTIGIKEFAQDNTPNVNNGYPIFSTQPLNDPYTIANGKELIIPSTAVATDIPSIITIKDSGSLINNGTASLLTNKKINIEKQLKAGEWNLVGSVLNSNTMAALNNNVGVTENTYQHDMAAVDYDYTSNNWNSTYLQTTDNFTIGKGYFVYPLNRYTSIGGNTYTDIAEGESGYGEYVILTQTKASGASTLNTNNVNISSISNTGDATSTSQTGLTTVTGKWFALSNPFIGKISVSKLCSSIGNEQGEKAIYTYNATEGKWEIPTYVYPGQGFMVASKTQTEGGSDYYTSLTGSIQTSNQGAKSNVEEETPSYITFTTNANNTTKEAFARISESASNGFDEKDAYVLLSSNNEDLVEPYFIVDNHAIMKNIYKTMPYTTPINFHASKESNTNLIVSNIPNNVSVSIVDLSNG
jgi:hypothetical protein